jgi:ATP-dependent Clp protease adaptor protein ClpS
MGEVVARDEFAVGGPLLLELRERAGVHHRAARFELMDMNIDHVRGLLTETDRGSIEAEAQATRCEVRSSGSPPIARRVSNVRKWRSVRVKSCAAVGSAPPMTDITTKPRTKVRLKTERPRLHKVILLNDDYTPREFVVTVLKGEFRMSEDQAYRVMMTAHRRGVCVVAVYTRDVAETKATRGTEAGRRKGYPLQFTTEPEE